jgi:hypothetical protein
LIRRQRVRVRPSSRRTPVRDWPLLPKSSGHPRTQVRFPSRETQKRSGMGRRALHKPYNEETRPPHQEESSAVLLGEQVHSPDRVRPRASGLRVRLRRPWWPGDARPGAGVPAPVRGRRLLAVGVEVHADRVERAPGECPGWPIRRGCRARYGRAGGAPTCCPGPVFGPAVRELAPVRRNTRARRRTPPRGAPAPGLTCPEEDCAP